MRHLIESRAEELAIPAGMVDKARVLGAICKIESAGWNNRQPNFEPAYYVGGRYFNLKTFKKAIRHCDPVLLPTMGALAASSFGPFQLMYGVALELGFQGTAIELADPRTNLEFCIRYINVRCVPKITAQDEQDWVTRVADGYNTGNPRDRIHNEAYEREVCNAYESDDLWDEFARLPVYQGCGG